MEPWPLTAQNAESRDKFGAGLRGWEWAVQNCDGVPPATFSMLVLWPGGSGLCRAVSERVQPLIHTFRSNSMRRIHFGLLAPVLAFVALPVPRAAATTMTEAVPVTLYYADPGAGPYNLDAVPFNPALGTLDQVVLYVDGSLTPSVEFGGDVPNVTLVTSLSVRGAGPTPGFFAQTVATENASATYVGAGISTAQGAAEAVNIGFGFINPAAIAGFVSSATTPLPLTVFEFQTAAVTGSIRDTVDVDDSVFHDQGSSLVYTYETVPEPATVLLFASGLFGTIGARLRRRR
jgi:hypothetical protein